MNREEKTVVVDELAERLGEAQAVFAVDYKGISVPQAAELRTKLRESDASFKVVKNRLAKLAAEKAGAESLDPLLTGPIALTLINGDPVVVAKTITTFTKDHDVLTFRGGIMDGEPLDETGFQAIARLPGLDVLHGQLVGLTASPLTGLVTGLGNLIAGLGRQLAQIAEQGLVSGSEADASPAVVEAADPSGSEADASPAVVEAADPTGEAPEHEAPVEEPTPADEPAPDEAPVEEPPAEEPAPEPEAEAGPPETSEEETEAQTAEEAQAGASDEVADGQVEPADESEPEPDGNEGEAEASGGVVKQED